MTCRELIDFLAEYVGGDLAPDVAAEFEAHLAQCDACVRYLEGYRRAIELGKAAYADREADVPPTVPEDLVAAILKTRPR